MSSKFKFKPLNLTPRHIENQTATSVNRENVPLPSSTAAGSISTNTRTHISSTYGRTTSALAVQQSSTSLAKRSSLPSIPPSAPGTTTKQPSLPHTSTGAVPARRTSLPEISTAAVAAAKHLPQPHTSTLVPARRTPQTQTSTASAPRPPPADEDDEEDLDDFDLSSSFISADPGRGGARPGRGRGQRLGAPDNDAPSGDDDCVLIDDAEFRAAVAGQAPRQIPPVQSDDGTAAPRAGSSITSITPPPMGLLAGLSAESSPSRSSPPAAESPPPPPAESPPPPDMDVDDAIEWLSPEIGGKTAAGQSVGLPEPEESPADNEGEEEEVIGSSQPRAGLPEASDGRLQTTPAPSVSRSAVTCSPPDQQPTGLSPQAVKLAVRLADLLEVLPTTSLENVPGLDAAKCRRLLVAYRRLTGRPAPTAAGTTSTSAASPGRSATTCSPGLSSAKGTACSPAGTSFSSAGAGSSSTSKIFSPAGTAFSPAGTGLNSAGTGFSSASNTFSPAGTAFSPSGTAFGGASSATSTTPSPGPSRLLAPPVVAGAFLAPPQPSPAETARTASYGTACRDDSGCEEFGRTHPFSGNMAKVFREMFGLRNFRVNQKEVITAALLKYDTFVLMPTGGGKSLCYQLPALLDPGVTVVISPLKSLIRDQISKLNSLDIPAAHLSGLGSSGSTGHNVFLELSQARPGVKLLYTTPEMVGASGRLKDALTSLYKRGLLSRLVIDEAHCVSQWGHDFRPDYKRLNQLRRLFPDTPVMALTATATPRVRSDILHQLGLEKSKVKWFVSSFNRANLRYEVVPKTKTLASDMAQFIREQHRGHTGIVYCFSKKDCDQLAAALRRERIQATAYHADLSDAQRGQVQDEWLAGKVKVICATIAFGMGVDKPDVRFVLHHALPKSLEGFYQESGRAGRDGLKADCLLYYGYRDVFRIKRLLAMSRENEEAHRTHEKNLWDIQRYAENITDCRRALVLQYFGERFDRAACRASPSTACDNCRRQGQTVPEDVTSLARDVVTAVREICGRTYGGNFTVQHLVDVLKGSKMKKIMDNGLDRLPLHGALKDWSRSDCERLMRHLLLERFLQEEMVAGREDIVNAYLRTGPRAAELTGAAAGGAKVLFPRSRQPASSSAAGRSDAARSAGSGDLEQRAAVRELCLQRLTELCQQLARAAAVPPATIINVQALHDMADRLPTDRHQMLQITHVTEANFAKYGAQLLEAIRPYAEQVAKMNERSAAAGGAQGTDKAAGSVGKSAGGGRKSAPRRRRKGPAAGVGYSPPAKKARTSQGWAAAAARNRALAVGRGRGRGAPATPRPQATGLGLVAPPQPRSFLAAPRVSLL